MPPIQHELALAPKFCSHPRLFPGLDHSYCPDCRRAFSPRSPEYKCVLEQRLILVPEHTRDSDRTGSNPDDSVLEQFAGVPEHTRDSGLPLQWLERYSVRRGNKAHEYYRYVWMQDRKFHHHHIPGGNTKNPIAIGRVLAIERAIALGTSPQEIEQILKSWRSPLN